MRWALRTSKRATPVPIPRTSNSSAVLGELKLQHSKIIAFGSTRKIGVAVQDDNNVQSLLKAGTQAIAIFFGKTTGTTRSPASCARRWKRTSP